jgi:hypothetical protein
MKRLRISYILPDSTTGSNITPNLATLAVSQKSSTEGFCSMPDFSEKKEVIALLIESPLYFTMPLKERLDLIKFISDDSPYNNLRDYFLNWVKTGHLKGS